MSFSHPTWQDETSAQVAFFPFILSSAGLLLFPFPKEFNPVAIFCRCTQAQKCACEYTPTPPLTHMHRTLWSLLQLPGCLIQGGYGLTCLSDLNSLSCCL